MGKNKGVRIKQVGGMKPPSKAALASMMQQPPTLEDFMVPPEEQISIPPPMNKKYQMFYPMHETFTMKQIHSRSYIRAISIQRKRFSRGGVFHFIYSLVVVVFPRW